MKCPRCAHSDTKVLESRLSQEGHSVRRRRNCVGCRYRFTTYEKIEELIFQVRKKDNRFEEFSREKLTRAIATACRKRRIPMSEIEAIVAGIEFRLREDGERVVSSSRIGDLVMDKLMAMDQVAYVRFASIYKNFKDPEQFMRELEVLGHSR